MSKQSFSPEQQALLRNNPYVYSVTNTRITFTKEFKELAWAAYQEGRDTRSIFIMYGFDIDLLGDGRIRSVIKHIKEEFKLNGEFHQGYQRSGMYSAKQSSGSDTDQIQLKKLQHEVDYLKQEIEFLKKISSIRNTRK